MPLRIIDFNSVNTNIVPSSNVTYDLGTANNAWRDIFLSGNTINLGGASISTDSDTGSVTIVPKRTGANPNPKAAVFRASGLASVDTANGVVSANAVANAAPAGASITTYANSADLPLVGVQAGAQAFVSETSRLFLYTGTGWYNIALINQSPTITSGSDASYAFEIDGTPIVITLQATDPENVPIAWSYAVTSGSLGNTATVSQVDNVFTITPSTNTENAGEFSITFTASDGVNLATAVSAFTLAFGVADQYYNSTSLLVKSGSTAGLNNTTFVDESTNGFTVTPTGDVHQGSLSPYSPAGWGVYFDGSTDYLDIPGNAAAFGTSDYTVEGWHYYTGAAATNTRFLIDCRFGGGSNLLLFFESAIYKLYIGGHVANGGTLVKNAWQHFALVRSSGSTKLYVNGTSVFTWADSTNYASTQIRLGRDVNNNDSLSWVGYMSDIRIVKGTAVYTSNFTPPTEPLTAISGTSLLVRGNNAGIYDEMSKNNIQVIGNATTSTTQTKYSDTSVYFDGTGDYVTSSTTAGVMGTGNFTIETWFYPTTSGTNRCIINTRTADGSTTGFYLGLTSLQYAMFYVPGEGSITTPQNSILADSWYHIAVVRNANIVNLYLNGVSVGSSTIGSNFTDTLFQIGGCPNVSGSSANYFSGYLEDVRITKGVARYTANFTPPTAALGFSNAE